MWCPRRSKQIKAKAGLRAPPFILGLRCSQFAGLVELRFLWFLAAEMEAGELQDRPGRRELYAVHFLGVSGQRQRAVDHHFAPLVSCKGGMSRGAASPARCLPGNDNNCTGDSAKLPRCKRPGHNPAARATARARTIFPCSAGEEHLYARRSTMKLMSVRCLNPTRL